MVPIPSQNLDKVLRKEKAVSLFTRFVSSSCLIYENVCHAWHVLRKCRIARDGNVITENRPAADLLHVEFYDGYANLSRVRDSANFETRSTALSQHNARTYAHTCERKRYAKRFPGVKADMEARTSVLCMIAE